MFPTKNPYAQAGVPDTAAGRAFIADTEGKIYYGVEPLEQAWHFYELGWLAAQQSENSWAAQAQEAVETTRRAVTIAENLQEECNALRDKLNLMTASVPSEEE